MKHAKGFTAYARATQTPPHKPAGLWYDAGRIYCACSYEVVGAAPKVKARQIFGASSGSNEIFGASGRENDISGAPGTEP